MLISKAFPSCMLEIKKKSCFEANKAVFNMHMHGQALTKTANILRHPWFSHEMMSEKQHRNSILMTHHYPDLGSASDRLKQISHVTRPIRSTTQIWVVLLIG